MSRVPPASSPLVAGGVSPFATRGTAPQGVAGCFCTSARTWTRTADDGPSNAQTSPILHASA